MFWSRRSAIGEGIGGSSDALGRIVRGGLALGGVEPVVFGLASGGGADGARGLMSLEEGVEPVVVCYLGVKGRRRAGRSRALHGAEVELGVRVEAAK